MKKLWIIGLIAILLMPLKVDAAAYDPQTATENDKTLDLQFYSEKPDIGFYLNSAASYILETTPNPGFGTIQGEWSVFSLLRGMYTGAHYIELIPEQYFENYVKKVEQRVYELDGNLDRNKSTEWSRTILSLTALGQDIKNVSGYNFIEKLSESYKFSYRQGINGPIWEIIAMNTGNYQFLKDASNEDQNSFTKMIDYILSKEITQVNGNVGGWALSGKLPDPDITGMALQALAPYYLDRTLYESLEPDQSYETLANAVERAIAILADIQDENGGFRSWGTLNSESTAQVIVALTSLQIDPLSDAVKLPTINRTVSFVKQGQVRDGVWTNNMIDALLSFYALNSGTDIGVGGFKHVTTGDDGGGGAGTIVNAMATDQALYALIAYDRFLQKQLPLYRMMDMQNGEYKTMKAQQVALTYVYADGKIEEQWYAPYEKVKLADAKGWKKSPFAETVYNTQTAFVMPRESIMLYEQSSIISESADVYEGRIIQDNVKPWTVTFSDTLADNADNKKAFTIRDHQGLALPVDIVIDDKKVHIKPLFTYVENQHYTVEVDATVTNKDGRLVLKGAKMPFVYQP